jgi:hypothetical protein
MAATGPRRNVDIRSNVAAAGTGLGEGGVNSPLKSSKTVQHEYDASKISDEQKKAKAELKRRFEQEKVQAAERKRVEEEEAEKRKQVRQQATSERTSQQTIDEARARAAERKASEQSAKRQRTEELAPLKLTPGQTFGAGVFVGIAGTIAFNRLISGVAKSVAPAAAPIVDAALE